VAGDLHRHPFPDSRPHHASHAAAAEIVEETRGDLLLGAVRVGAGDLILPGFDARLLRDLPARASRWWRTFLCAVVAVVLLTAAGCSSVSICLEQEKGVSASEDARSQGCAPNRPTRSREREQEMRDGQARSGVANRTEKLHWRG